MGDEIYQLASSETKTKLSTSAFFPAYLLDEPAMTELSG